MISEKNESVCQGDYVDFKDTNGEWVIGLIVGQKADKIKVRSQGWPSKYDEIIPVTSNRIRPFRSIVRGYTGQQKNPGTREHWKFQVHQHEELIKQFKEFIQKQNHQESKWNQFIRGKHYFYLDFLMGLKYQSKQQLSRVYEYFKAHLQLVKKLILKLDQQEYEKWSNLTQYKHFQVFDGLRIISGLQVRHTNFTKNNQKLFNDLEEGMNHQKCLNELIKESQVDTLVVKMIENIEKYTQQALPVPFLLNLMGAFQSVENSLIKRQQFKRQDRKASFIRVFQILKLNLEKLKAIDLKDLQTQQELEMLFTQFLKLAFKYFSGAESTNFQWLRKIKIKCAIMLLDIDSLERKFKAISELKRQFESTVKSEYVIHPLSPSTFVKQLENNSVLSKIFQLNEHPEVIRKGGQLWLNLYKEKVVPFDHFEFIWSQSMNKHESVKKIVLNLWKELISIASQDIQKFIKVAVNRYKNQQDIFEKDQWEYESYLSLIEKLFQNHTKNTQTNQLYYEILEVGYQNLLKIKDEKAMGGKLTKFSKTLLLSEESNRVIKQCYIQLGKNKNVEFHLSLLIEIYSQVQKSQTFMATNAFKILLMVLQTTPQSCTLVLRLISELENFSNRYADCQIFNLPQFEQLWKVAHSNSNITNIFLEWLIREHAQPLTSKSVYEINPVLSSELKQQIFSKILCDFAKFDYINMSLQQFYIFQEFFLSTNVSLNKIDIISFPGLNRIIAVKNEDLAGTKYIWDIFMNCKNEEVFILLNKLIITAYLHSQKLCDEKTRQTKVNGMMIKIEKNLRDGYRKGNYRILKASLQLLKSVILFVKQKPLPWTTNPANSYFKFTHKIRFNNKLIQVQTSFSSNYAQIKQKIVNELKIDINSIRLMSNKFQQIGIQYDEIPFCFMQDKQLQICIKEPSEFRMCDFVLKLVNTKIYPLLLSIVQDEGVCQQVFQLLEELSIQEKDLEQIISKLKKTLDHRKLQNQTKNVEKNEIYLLTILIKILQGQPEDLIIKLIEENEFILKDAITFIGYKFEKSQDVEYIEMVTGILNKLLKMPQHKNIKVITDLKQEIAKKVIEQIHVVTNPECLIDEEYKINLTKVCLNCLNIFESVKEIETLTSLFNNELFLQSTKNLYAFSDNPSLKFIFTEKIKKLVLNYLQQNQSIYQQTEVIILNLLSKQIYPSLRTKEGKYSKQKGSTHFYNLAAFIIEKCSQNNFRKQIVQSKFHQIIFQQLKQLSDSKNQSSCNYILKSHLDIMTAIFLKDPSLMNNDLFIFFVYECLFYLKDKTKVESIKCLRRATISACLKTLKAGINNSQQKLTELIGCLSELQKEHHWKIDDDWTIASQPEKQETYKGLQNPGCICFMNSLLQQLYMTKQFRESLINTDTTASQNSDVVKGLKELFLEMAYSEENQLSSLEFSKSIKGSDKKPMISIYNQMDIDEFSGILFDRIQNQLHNLKSNNFVKQIFGGVFAQQIVCHSCSYSSERQQDFLTVGIEMKKDLYEGLSYLVKGQILDGQNKYSCEGCNSKVKAQKFLSIKKLPECLIVSLKRFQYDFEIDAKIKINNYCEFPEQLNLLKYTQQEVLSKYLQNQNGQNKLKEEDCQYQLKGVVIHEGSADSGHYYSLIKEPEGRWIQFNDSVVSTFDITKLPEQAFGTKEEDETSNKNAYLIIYERVKSNHTTIKQIPQCSETKAMIKVIQDKNKQIQKAKIFFSDEYDEFISYVWEQFENYRQTGHYQEFLNFILDYFLTVRIRESSLPHFINLAKKIKKSLQRDPDCRMKLLEKCKNFNFIESIFIFCSIRIKCTIISQIMADTFNLYLDQVPDSLINEDGLLHIMIKTVVIPFALHGNINELNTFLRIILEKQQNEGNNKIVRILIDLNYHQICLKNILDREFSKDEKQRIISTNIAIKPQQKQDEHGYAYPKANTPQKRQTWKVFNIVLRHICKQQEKQFVFDELKQALRDFLLKGNFAKLINEAKTASTIRTIYGCLKQLQLLSQSIAPIEKGLKDFNSLKFRPLFIFLSYIIRDNNEDQVLLQQIVQSLQKVLIANEKFFLESNISLQWITNIMHLSSTFCTFFKKNEELMFKVLNLLEKHYKPAPEMVNKHKNPLNERLLNKINGIIVSADPKDYQNATQIMQEQLLSLQLGQFKPQTKPSLFAPENKIQVGDCVKFMALLSGSIKVGTVIDIQFGKYMIKFKGSERITEFDEQDERLKYISQQQFQNFENNENSEKKKMFVMSHQK